MRAMHRQLTLAKSAHHLLLLNWLQPLVELLRTFTRLFCQQPCNRLGRSLRCVFTPLAYVVQVLYQAVDAKLCSQN